jgi:PAS domain S-box-containing protein
MIAIDFKAMFYNAPVALIITDENGVIRSVNKNTSKFLETEEAQLTGGDFMELLQPSGERSVFSFSAFRESLDTQFDYLIKPKNGTAIYIQISCHAHPQEDENLYLFSFQPIKTNEQINYDLKERVKEQLCIMNVIDTFFSHPDLEDALRYCLPVICDGFRFPELAAARIRLSEKEIFTSYNFQETEWMISSTIESTMGKIGILEVAYLVEVPLHNGRIFPLEKDRMIYLIARIMGMLIQKWRAVNAIRESEQMIRKITSQVPGNTYMFEIEESGKPNILFVNRGTDEFNYSIDLEDISLHSEKVLEVWHEDDRPIFYEKMKEAYGSQSMMSFQYRVVLNGMIRWRWLQAVPEKGKNGKMVWYGATRDITSLVDYIVSVEQILFDISHVMRKPISSMLGITTLITEGELNEEKVLLLTQHLQPIAEEMDKFIKELNHVYEQKRQTDLFNIDFSSLVDKRNSLFKSGE